MKCAQRSAITALLALVSLVLVCLALVGCGKQLNEAECGELLDHYTELLIRSDRPKTTAAEQDKLKAETRAKAARDPAFSTCASDVSRRKFECAMAAMDVDSMERCLQ